MMQAWTGSDHETSLPQVVDKRQEVLPECGRIDIVEGGDGREHGFLRRIRVAPTRPMSCSTSERHAASAASE